MPFHSYYIIGGLFLLTKKYFKTNKEINKEELLTENHRYVEAVAKQYLNRGLTLEQLIEEGNKGLLKAADLYDESKGSSFIAYAVWWVRKSILQALAAMEQGKPNLNDNK